MGYGICNKYGGASIEGYEQWLKEHDNTSPLYYGKNKDVFTE